MNDFTINNCEYSYSHYQPNGCAKYGLAITFWKTNVEQLMFFLKYIDTWINRELIDVSICSFIEAPNGCEKHCNYIVKCSKDGGHQDGTTLQCNGAMWPLMMDKNIKTVTHTDADQFILNEQYFFGQANILLDTGKIILTSTISYDFQNGQIMLHKELGQGITERQFGSFFIFNKLWDKAHYWPFIPSGNFESDRYEQFIKRFRIEDAIILKRLEFVYRCCSVKHFDFHLGVYHNAEKDHNLLDVMGREINDINS